VNNSSFTGDIIIGFELIAHKTFMLASLLIWFSFLKRFPYSFAVKVRLCASDIGLGGWFAIRPSELFVPGLFECFVIYVLAES
jgi:hypothetical protein